MYLFTCKDTIPADLSLYFFSSSQAMFFFSLEWEEFPCDSSAFDTVINLIEAFAVIHMQK